MNVKEIGSFSLEESFKEIEEIMPGIKAKPGYFKHEPKSAYNLADWVERYQKLVKEHLSKFGSVTFSNFDTETTGLDAPEVFRNLDAGITDIAASRLVNGVYLGNEIDDDGNQSEGINVNEFNSLCNPGVEIPDDVSELTGITNEMIANADSQYKVLRDFKKFTKNTILMGHNVGDSLHNQKGYDIYNVIGPIYNRYFGQNVDNLLEQSIDTLPLFRFLIKGTSHTNDDFCNMLGVTLKGAHRAMPDVRANALAFSKIKPFLDHLNVHELRKYAKENSKKDSFIISAVQKGGNNDDSWCEVVIRLNDEFKVRNKYGRTVVSYSTVKLINNNCVYQDTVLRDGSILSAAEIKDQHPESSIKRKVLVKEYCDDLDSLIEKYKEPIIW